MHFPPGQNLHRRLVVIYPNPVMRLRHARSSMHYRHDPGPPSLLLRRRPRPEPLPVWLLEWVQHLQPASRMTRLRGTHRQERMGHLRLSRGHCGRRTKTFRRLTATCQRMQISGSDLLMVSLPDLLLSEPG